MGQLILLLVIGSTIFVGVDRYNLGRDVQHRASGNAGMGTFTWVLAMLLLWIVAFPVYLATRPKMVQHQKHERIRRGINLAENG